MHTETQHKKPLSDVELVLLCRDFLLSMMRSASTDRIPPREWWEQAKAALEIGAEEETFEEMTSAVARRLHIESLTKTTANWISSHEAVIRENWPAFRRMCRRSAVYIAGMARVARDEQRTQKEAWDE